MLSKDFNDLLCRNQGLLRIISLLILNWYNTPSGQYSLRRDEFVSISVSRKSLQWSANTEVYSLVVLDELMATLCPF